MAGGTRYCLMEMPAEAGQKLTAAELMLVLLENVRKENASCLTPTEFRKISLRDCPFFLNERNRINEMFGSITSFHF